MRRVWSRLLTLLPALSLLSLLAACASFPPNPPLQRYDASSGYRFDNLSADARDDSLFVVATFSGGGTRAAAFAYGALEALHQTVIDDTGRTLLDELDVVSSVSGGSFPAAYLALRGEQIFTRFPQRFLYRPIEQELVGLLFSPTNLAKLAGDSFGSS
ncbi:MAG: patatin-like phospholipase family protein, partial [Gammaproteobacteria bacterium]|nr:patatin-like phospholipase family protein [Gammaproteobacteria bacterium]